VACTGAVEIAVHGWDVSTARGRAGPIPPAPEPASGHRPRGAVRRTSAGAVPG
jgi:hypothetical protein